LEATLQSTAREPSQKLLCERLKRALELERERRGSFGIRVVQDRLQWSIQGKDLETLRSRGSRTSFGVEERRSESGEVFVAGELRRSHVSMWRIRGSRSCKWMIPRDRDLPALVTRANRPFVGFVDGLRAGEGAAAFGCLRALEGAELGFPELEVGRLRSVEWSLRKWRSGH